MSYYCTHLFDTWYPYIVSEVTGKIMANYKEYNIQAATSLFIMAGGNVPAALVLAGPVFLKVKMKFNFYKKQVINKGASVIFGLVRLIILSYNR